MCVGGIVSSLSCIYMCWGYSFVPVMYMCVGGIVSPLSCIYGVGGIVSPLSCICVLGV